MRNLNLCLQFQVYREMDLTLGIDFGTNLLVLEDR